MKNKTIQYEDLIYRNKQLNSLKEKGFIIIPKKKCRLFGYITIGASVLTIPLPFTSLPLFILGCGLLGLSHQDILEKIRRKIKLMLYKLRR